MKVASLAQVLFTSAFLFSRINGAEAATVQTFDSETSTSLAGWFGTGNTNFGNFYGFTNSNITGQTSPAGEAGGVFVHATNAVSSYGVSLGKSFTLNDSFHADGEWAAPSFTTIGNTIYVGFYNSTNIGASAHKNKLGMSIQEAAASGLRVRAGFYFDNATFSQGSSSQVINLGTTNTSGRFSFDYNPFLSSSNGSLTVVMYKTDGTLIGSRTTSLTLAQRTGIGTNTFFDSFGITVGGTPGAPDTNTSTFFIDNVQFYGGPLITCISPSPSQLVSAIAASNQTVNVTVPNTNAAINVVVTSLNTNIAVPVGADANGSITLSFPANTTTPQSFQVHGIAQGSVAFTLSNTNGSCVDAPVTITVVPPPRPVIVKTENFDTANSAGTNGWVEFLSRSNGHNYGFSAGDHNGTGTGEAGGTFTKTTAARSYYADVFPQPLTLNDRIHAKGKFILVTPLIDNEIQIGHSLSTATANNGASPNLVGFSIAEPNRLTAFLGFADGTVKKSAVLFNVTVGQSFNWEYTYDPTNGSSGSLTLVFDDGAGGSVTGTVAPSAPQRFVGASVDSFGITYRGLIAQTNDTAELYIDNVEYDVLPALLKITKIENLASTIRLTFSTPTVNATHQITRTENLTAPSWAPISGVTFGSDNGKLTAEFARTNQFTEFYRVQLP